MQAEPLTAFASPHFKYALNDEERIGNRTSRNFTHYKVILFCRGTIISAVFFKLYRKLLGGKINIAQGTGIK